MKTAKLTASIAASALAGWAAMNMAVAQAEGPDSQSIGEPGRLVNGGIVQEWTVQDLKPSTDEIPYNVRGTLWEVTATDVAVSGGVIPVVSNLNARTASGENYRALFGVATPQGVNPATLAEGEKTTGKVYFDVVGEAPESVVYNSAGKDLLVWVEAPEPAAEAPAGTSSSAPVRTAPETTTDETTEDAESDAEASDTDAATEGTAEGDESEAAPAGSQGTPAPEGDEADVAPRPAAVTEGADAAAAEAVPGAPEAVSGAPEATPTPVGSQGTPAPANVEGAPAPAAATTEPVPGAVPAAPATPAHAGSQGTPAVQAPAQAPVNAPVTAPPTVPTTAPVPHGPAA